MNARYIKLIALMLALILMLSGCNLIEIDPKMQAEEDIAKLDKAYSAVVASYDGGEVTAGEAMSLFNSTYNEMYYMYQYYFGMEMTEEEVHGIMEGALKDTVRLKIAARHFDESYSLSEEELAQAETDAAAYYNEAYNSLYQAAAGDSDLARQMNTLVMLREVGMDEATNYANTIRDAKAMKMEEILMAEVQEPGEEDLLAAYEARVIEDEDLYSFDDGSFESVMMEDDPAVCWIPEGYRTVKHILLIPDEELMNSYVDAVYALEDQEFVLDNLQLELETLLDDDTEEEELFRTEADIRGDIEDCEALMNALRESLDQAKQACLENVKPLSDEVYAKLAAGEDFETVMAQYGQDPGMQNEPTMSRGYYVRATSANWEQNFTGGAMALEKVGDYSPEPVLSGSGAHIILYASDVQGGAVPFEQVRDSLYDATLEEMRYNHSDAAFNTWVEEAHAVYDVAAFEKAIFDSFE